MSTFNSTLWGRGQPGFAPIPAPPVTPNSAPLTGNFGQTQPGYIPISPAQLFTSKVIYAAYRIAGILRAPQRGLSPEEIQEGLECFNALIDAWNAQRYTILSITRQVFTLIPNKQTYVIGIGAGADWVTQRPPKIEDVSLISLENPSDPLEIPLQVLTFDNWQLIALKSTPSTYPQCCWYDAAQQWLPNAHLSFWPVPTLPYQVALYGWSQIAQSVNGATPLILAPGYQQALQYELAVELCPRWNKPVPPDVRIAAIEYKKIIKSVNAPILDLRCDEALIAFEGGWYNWRSDTYGRGGGY